MSTGQVSAGFMKLKCRLLEIKYLGPKKVEYGGLAVNLVSDRRGIEDGDRLYLVPMANMENTVIMLLLLKPVDTATRTFIRVGYSFTRKFSKEQIQDWQNEQGVIMLI